MKPEKDYSLHEFSTLIDNSCLSEGEISQAGNLVYISMLIFLVCLLISLPFIKVNITVRAPGIIRPVCERTVINSLVAGKIEQIHFREGMKVNRGQVLITLEHDEVKQRLAYYQFEKTQISLEITDLIHLLEKKDTQMVSVRYRFENELFQDHLRKIQEQLNKARKEKERLDLLFREKLISEKEYDDLSYNQAQLEKEIRYLISNAMNNWQTELSRLKYQSGQAETEISRIEYELDQSIICAPVSGRIDLLAGIYEGSSIQPGQDIATISPDTLLIGEFYVSPDDIGQIRYGQETTLIVDAFDYREWGVIKGRISDIPDDFILINNKPVFRIECIPEQDHLHLRNRIEGKLKKGMTFQARSVVTSHSLAYLITGKFDSWFNPASEKKYLSFRN